MTDIPVETDLSVTLLRRAESLIALRRYVDAVPWLGRAIAADPHNARPYCLLAIALYYLREFPRALEAAQRAAAVDPSDEWPQRLRSMILLYTGKKPEALAAAREAVRLDPQSAGALAMLAHAALACGKKREAERAAQRMAEIAPEEGVTYETLASVAIRRKKWTDAEKHLRRALSLDPQSYEAMNDLGLVLQEQGKHMEAIMHFHSAAKLNPVDDQARHNLYGAIRDFLRPTRPLLAAAVLIFAILDGIAGTFYFPVAITLGIAGYLVWLRYRRRALPPVIADLYRREREWVDHGPRPSPKVVRILGIFTAVIWGLALLGLVLNGSRYSVGNWAVLTLVLALMTFVFAQVHSKARTRR